jgi:hypothetical protein
MDWIFCKDRLTIKIKMKIKIKKATGNQSITHRIGLICFYIFTNVVGGRWSVFLKNSPNKIKMLLLKWFSWKGKDKSGKMGKSHKKRKEASFTKEYNIHYPLLNQLFRSLQGDKRPSRFTLDHWQWSWFQAPHLIHCQNLNKLSSFDK